MKSIVAIASLAVLLSACAGTGPPVDQAEYQAYCRTHARKVTYSGSPDENIPYLECMHIKGSHEVEVSGLGD